MKKLVPLLGIVISIVFLLLTFRNVDFRLMAGSLVHVSVLSIMGALVCDMLFFIARAQYQRNNLSTIKKHIGFKTSLSTIAAAQFFNNLLPARIGEVVRSVRLSKLESIPTASILSYIVIEKIVDVIIMFVLLLIILAVGFGTIETGRVVGVVAIAVLAAVISILIYVRCNSFLVNVFLRRLPDKIKNKSISINTDLITGFKSFKSVKQIGIAVFWLIASWACVWATFYFLSFSYAKLLDLPWYASLFFMVFSVFSLSIPSAPSGIGVVHYGLFLAMGLLSPDSIKTQVNTVAAFVVFLHLSFYVLDLLVSGSVLLITRSKQA